MLDVQMVFFWIIILILFFLLKIWWKNRNLYYYGAAIPGLFNLPPFGSVSLIKILFNKDILGPIENIIKTYQPVGKFWVGSQLFLFTTRPKYIEIILTKCLNKPGIYSIIHSGAKNSLATSGGATWKKNRKLINPAFNRNLLNSFQDVFVKYSNNLVQVLDSSTGEEVTNFLEEVGNNALDAAIETLASLNPDLIKERYKSLQAVKKLEKQYMERVENVWLLSDLIFKNDNFFSQCKLLGKQSREFVENILYRFEEFEDTKGSKPFLPFLIDISKKTKRITTEQIFEETLIMLLAASETSASTVTFVLMVLGIIPKVQEKVYEEINGSSEPTVEDIAQMHYLHRVIQETLRMFPIFPLILRKTDEDIHLNPYTFPAGSSVMIPISLLHKDPEVWPDPEKFDPDRFLPEEVKKRHPCSYIPFSYGARN